MLMVDAMVAITKSGAAVGEDVCGDDLASAAGELTQDEFIDGLVNMFLQDEIPGIGMECIGAVAYHDIDCLPIFGISWDSCCRKYLHTTSKF